MNSAHIAADHMISGDMLPKKTPKRWSGRNSVQNMEEWNVVSNHPNKLFIRRQSCASDAILQFHIFVTHWFYGSMDPGVVSNSGSDFKDQGTAKYINWNTSCKKYRSVHNVQTNVKNGLTMDDKLATSATHNAANSNVKWKRCILKVGGSNRRRM